MHEVAIAFRVLRQKNDRGPPGLRLGPARRELAAIAKIERQRGADDGLDAFFGEFFGKLQRAEQIIAVGDRQRGHGVGRRQLHQFAD